MELTEEQIEDLKSLVRVSMDMHDKDNWNNGEYFGDARKFWEGAEIGVDMWVNKMRASQKPETSDEALHIGSVGGNEVELCATCQSPLQDNFREGRFCVACNVKFG